MESYNYHVLKVEQVSLIQGGLSRPDPGVLNPSLSTEY